MITTEEVRDKIRSITKSKLTILTRYPQTFDVNLIVAVEQCIVKAQLDILYELLGEERPRFNCDNMAKQNH